MLRINNLKYDIKAYVTDSMLLDYAKKQICLKLKLKDSEIKELKLLRKILTQGKILPIFFMFLLAFTIEKKNKYYLENIILLKNIPHLI